jgi:predicted ribosome quality control (RQC) complex YloA/Tae2 family protein
LILDSLTIAALASELARQHVGQYIRRARADETGLDVLFGANPTEASTVLQLRFGPPASLSLAPAEGLTGTGREGHDNRERYLEDSRIDGVTAVSGDRILQLQLSRPDAASQRTHGLFHVVLIPPVFRAVLVSQRHGRVLGVWAGDRDRQAPLHGADYHGPTAPADRLVPGRDDPEVFVKRLLAQDHALGQALRQSISGADRHLVGRVCADVGLDPDIPTANIDESAARKLWAAAQQLWAAGTGPAFRWTRTHTRVSIAAPKQLAASEVSEYHSVCAALRPVDSDTLETALPAEQRSLQELARGLRILQRRAAGLQKDLDETAMAPTLERTGNSLMSASSSLPPGGCGRVPDAHDASGTAMIDVQLAPGESAVQQGTSLLRRAAKLRRRATRLPPRLHRVQELIFETERLLDRLRAGEQIPEGTMERWERRVEIRQSPARDGAQYGRQADERQGARPRRYRTSSGWSVWAGRSNRENDIVTHRLAGQNDLWFHAHGYAGSHVILRREGRKEEPSGQTLEEAAAVAAYWSKGRTANKVPVVYTLAKYVSKPRGGAPGLAVLKREKTIMIRPSLLPEEEQE